MDHKGILHLMRRGERTRGHGLLVALTALFFLVGLALGAQTITLLHVNDSHSHLDQWGPKDDNLEGTLGGIAKVATVIGETRATDANVLVLHAGDVFHGDFFFNAYFGVPELQLLQQLGFDAMAVGNHEFDFGPDVLANSLNTAYGSNTLPLLSANLDMTAYPALETWIKPSILKDVGGVEVGIFGMTVPNVPTSQPAPVVILGGDDPNVLMTIAGNQAATLRAEGAQVVIMLSHLGYTYDQVVAQKVPGIDLIVGGHDHYVFQQPKAFTNPSGGQTYVVQAGKFYQYVGKMHFTYADGGITIDDYQLIPMDATVPAAPEITAVVDQLKAGIVQQYGDVYQTVLATAAADITTTYDPAQKRRDTAMGDLLTDAMRQKTGTDIAVTPNGLISEGLCQGPIVGDDIFKPVSFGYDVATGLGFKIATFQITGTNLRLGLEAGLANLPYSEDAFIQVSGLTYSYNSRKASLHRLKPASVKINGKPVKNNKTYTVTANEGVVALLPLFGIQVTNLQMLPDLEYDVLKDYIVSKGTVSPETGTRIKDVAAGK